MQVHSSRMVNIMKYSQPTLMLAKSNKIEKKQKGDQAEIDVDSIYIKLIEECGNLKEGIMKKDVGEEGINGGV